MGRVYGHQKGVYEDKKGVYGDPFPDATLKGFWGAQGGIEKA